MTEISKTLKIDLYDCIDDDVTPFDDEHLKEGVKELLLEGLTSNGKVTVTIIPNSSVSTEQNERNNEK